MINKSSRLSRKVSAFGLAFVASLALSGLAAGSASALSIDPSPVNYSVSGSGALLTKASGNQFSCEKAAGTGTFKTGTTGQTTIQFQGCYTYVFGSQINCTSPGKPAGTIVTSALGVKPVYLDAAHTKYGLMFSPPASGVFAEVNCFGSGTWIGSLIGEITNPALNTYAQAHTLRFRQVSAGLQEHRQIEGAGPVYNLSWNGQAMAIDTTWTMWFPAPRRYLP
jgi:hypothetical protein